MTVIAEQHRNQVIDAFRGMAVLGVVVVHYLVRWAPPFWPQNLPGYSGQYPVWLGLGGLGVHVFFVISGFVIAMTAAQCRTVADFSVKRIARLWPAFIVAATITFLAMRLGGPPPFQVNFADYLVSLTMLPANLGYAPVDGAYWSLAIELRFYILTAIGFFFFRQKFWQFLLVLCVVGSLLGFVRPNAAYLILLGFMPLFLLGVAGWLGLWARQRGNAALVAATALFFYFLTPPAYPDQLSQLAAHAFVLGISGLMMLLLWWAPRARFGGLSLIGRISYSLYLYHQFLGVTAISYLVAAGMPDLAAAGTVLLLILCLSWLSFTFVEEPGRRAIIRWYGKRLAARRPFPASAD